MRFGPVATKATAIAVAAVAFALALLGWSNPWNLRYVERLWDPLAFLLMPVGVVGLLACWNGQVGRSQRLRRVGQLVLTWLLVLVVLFSAVLALANHPQSDEQRARNSHNDLVAFVRFRRDCADIVLSADRGLWSRENVIHHVGCGDSARPALRIRFIGPNSLMAESDAGFVYRARIDGRDLDVLEEHCTGSGCDDRYFVGGAELVLILVVFVAVPVGGVVLLTDRVRSRARARGATRLPGQV